MVPVVNMQDAKSDLSRLAQRAADGEDIVIARHGKPLARLTRLVPPPPQGTLLGVFAGKLQMSGDFDEIPGEFGEYV